MSQGTPNNQLPPNNTNQLRAAQQQMSEVSASVAVLRTEADRARSLFGFGRRILVPPDEIHVVVGDGRHMWRMSNERRVFGQTADRPSRYWLNGHTQVIKLKTISFTVGIRGPSNLGVEALDSSKVSFRIWAHAVAKLNPDKAEVAAQRVGLDTTGLINTITEVGTAELVAAAATMGLEDIIANRQKLAEIAFPKVNQILSELGYDLALLTITQLDGEAYHKLIRQAEARISKETSVATNREQLAELHDDQGREQAEAEIRASTEKKLASERLEAEQNVETATISQQEALDIRRHEMQLKAISRVKAKAEADQEAELTKVQLGRQLAEAETEKLAQIARLEAERQAELKALAQQRTAQIQLAETQAGAERMALAQAREIERAAALTDAEALRLKQEELAAAQRSKEIALLETSQMAESLQLEAKAEAQALQLRTEAQTKAALLKAEAEADAAEKQAKAATIRAEATRAETAAPGLAQAEVESAQVNVSEARVAVTRAEGLAAAEVSRAQAEAEAERLERLKSVDINAQRELAELYEHSPILIDLEKMRMRLTHEEKLATIQAEASLKVFEAIAPGVKIHIVGDGGAMGKVMSNLMSLSHGLNVVSEEVPLVRQLLGQNGDGAGLVEKFGQFTPYLRRVLADMNPRMLSSLKVTDLVDRLAPVVAGEEKLATALSQIQQDASFRVIGDMPISPVLNLLGIDSGETDAAVEEIVVERK